MLQRSFKPAKCKTSLQMASSRLKILKNKKDIQIRQLKKELGQLLEAGQDQNARIRVEHVVREEKMVAAYELVGIYCELLVARMAVIESQKKCPNDLKEAVASILFASGRMADVTELIDVHKHFTAKYGKDFVSAAVELRPACGVSRLLVEKLSVKAPDGPTKVKILCAIAEEQNVKWESKSFGEPDSKLSDDLLSGTPNSYETAAKMHMYPPQAENREPSNVQHPSPTTGVPRKSTERYDVRANSYAYEGRSPSSSNSQKVTSFHSKATEPESYKSNSRLSDKQNRGVSTGGETEEMVHKHSYHVDEDASPLSRRSWSMEFKDATSAAHAAAESAEIASMAARAAVELSNRERIMRQNSTESQNSPSSSSSYGFRNESLQRYSGSNLQSEGYAEIHHSSGRNHRMQYEDMNSPTRQHKLEKEFQNGKTNRNDETSDHYFQTPGRSSRKNSSEMRQSDSFGKSDAGQKLDAIDSNFGYMKDHVHVRKQPSGASSRSHSSNLGDDHEYSDTKRVHSSYDKSNSHGDACDHDVLDDYGSSSDKPKFDSEDEHDNQEYGYGFSLLSQKSPGHRSKTASSWSVAENQEDEHGSLSHSVTEKHSSPALGTGGLKNKGKTLPPYTKSRSRDKHEQEDYNASSTADQPSVSSRTSSNNSYSGERTHSRNPGPSFRTTPESKKPVQNNGSISSPVRGITTSADTKTEGARSVESPKNKASHVHPKLPDWDDLFAKFGALRSNR